MKVGLNLELCRYLGFLLSKIRFFPPPFTDDLYYPSLSCDGELIADYFFFMVAIDHRTSIGDFSFNGRVHGREFHGANLLWRLGKLKFNSDPETFLPSNMKNVSTRDILEWFRVDFPLPTWVWDPDVRVFLLRDTATKLVKHYDGSVLNLIEKSGGYLYCDGAGLIERLKIFRAYEDPVGKKAFLLVKFLERRGLLEVVDEDNLNVAVDNHLTRIALRLGIVHVDVETLNRIVDGKKFTSTEDYALRLRVRETYKLVSAFSKVRPTVLDDFLWLFGKYCCRREAPVCVTGCDRIDCPVMNLVGNCYHSCPLYSVCKGRFNPKLQMIPEHNFTETWYY